MRLIYSHAETGTKVTGVRLGPGATINDNDVYNSSDGKWRRSDNFVHTVIARGCMTVWIRTTGLSDSARDLLEQLIIRTQYLTNLTGVGWKRIPTPGEIADDRVHWHVDPLAAEELRSAGLITHMLGDQRNVFEVSDAGKKLLLVK